MTNRLAAIHQKGQNNISENSPKCYLSPISENRFMVSTLRLFAGREGRKVLLRKIQYKFTQSFLSYPPYGPHGGNS